ncbi:hypothetical protein [Geotalea toluenoxydans]|uniref:hypothetical protein n=1 Tax=Geotalea toluenoxydans TaxID=421624 RepID=UPI0006D009A4|nr:hypothetical protein [Geotalea toluenoxydans]
MGNRFIFSTLLFFILMACAGCSGSGTAGTSKVTVSFGQAAAKGSATAKTVFAGMTAAATSTGILPSIVKKITITVTAPDMTDIVRVITVAPGQTSASDSFAVPNGSGRVFKVIAQDNYNNTPYTGSTTVDLNGTDTAVPVTMQEDVNQAVTAKLYQYFKDTIEAKGTALTAADLAPFYATSFGIHDGLSRTAAIDFDVKDYKFGDILTKGMVSLTASAKPLSATVGSPVKVTGKGFFKDGSYGFPDDGFIMIKENGEWKITGNNFLAAIELRGITSQWLGGPTALRVESGLLVRVEDRGNAGLTSAVVTGPGLPTGGIVLAKDPLFPQKMQLGNAYFPTPPLSTMQWEMYVMADASLAGIADNSVYTFTIYDSNNVVVETRTSTLPRRPWLRSEATSTSGYFPALAGISPISAATNGHFLADARIGSTLAYNVSTPTAFQSSWFDTSLNYYGWDTLGKAGYYFQRDLLLTDTSVSLSSTLPVLALGGSLSVTAEDFDNRRQIQSIWLFNGPVSAAPMSSVISFMTTTAQVTGGVTSPAAGDIWKFGAASPVVTWEDRFFSPLAWKYSCWPTIRKN